MERLKYQAESAGHAIDFAVQECPEYDWFMVAGYTPPAGKPGYYTVLAFEDEEERLELENEYNI